MIARRIATVLAATISATLCLPSVALANPAPNDTIEVAGELVLAIAENQHGDDRDTDELVAAIQTPDGFVPVEADAVADITPGSQVIATVTETTNEPAVVEDVVVLADASTVPEPAVRTHTARVMVVTPAGVTPDLNLTSSDATDVVERASDFWEAQGTGVTINVTHTVAPYTSQFTCAQYWDLWDEAKKKSGYAGTAGDHLIVLLPASAYETGGCSYGLGTVGSSVNSGGMLYATENSTSAMAHELGHNLSLRHAQVFTDAAGETANLSNIIEYGNYHDVMGYSFSNHYGALAGNVNARQQARLGLLSTSQQKTVTSTGTITLGALDTSAGDVATVPRLVSVTDVSTGYTYFLEYRSQLGNDSNNLWDTNPGIVVYRDSISTGVQSVAIDTHKNSGTSADAALGNGQTWTSIGGGVRIEVTSTTPANATVRLTIAGSTPVQTTKVTISGKPTFYTPGDLIATVTPANATGSVRFAAVNSNGWSTVIAHAPVSNGTAVLNYRPVPLDGGQVTAYTATYLPSTTAFAESEARMQITTGARQTQTWASVSGSTARFSVGGMAGYVPTGVVRVEAKSTATSQTTAWDVRLDAAARGETNLAEHVPSGLYNVNVFYSGDMTTVGYRTYGDSKALAGQVLVGYRLPATLTVSPISEVVVGSNQRVAVRVTAAGTVPTGTVTLKNGSTVIATSPVGAGGFATLTAPANVLAAQTWTVSYEGSGVVAPAWTVTRFTVAKVPASVKMEFPNRLVARAQNTAVVRAWTSNGTAANGTVTLYYGNGAVGSAQVVNGQANVPIVLPRAGDLPLRAVFTGAGNVGNAEAALTVFTHPAPTTVMPTMVWQAKAGATVPVTITATSPNVTPAGTVEVRENGVVRARGILVNGTVTLSVPVGSVRGAKPWVIAYTGSTVNVSTSRTVTFTVL